MIAALYVQTGGCYFGLPEVDPWDEARDARKYAGPWRVVAHPPCARWSRLHGFVEHVYPGRFKRGDDGGCFEAALSAVRAYGGVLEHPAASFAWRTFGLNTPPTSGAWVVADFEGGWTCCVEQSHYGHPSRKQTWLYAHGVELPSLKWGRTPGEHPWVSFLEYNSEQGQRRASRTGIVQRQSKNQRNATPPQFRDVLLSIAGSCPPDEGAGTTTIFRAGKCMGR